MTVEELIEKLKQFPSGAMVCPWGSTIDRPTLNVLWKNARGQLHITGIELPFEEIPVILTINEVRDRGEGGRDG